MKTIIFNGSPRKNGDTVVLIHELMEHLEGEVLVVNAYESQIKGCVDCRFCWKHPRCAFADFQDLDQAIRNADNLVIASPIYFSEITGELLKILSKTQVYWSGRFIRHDQVIVKPKKGGVMLAYAGNCNLKYPLHTADLLLRNMGVEEIFTPVTAGDTDNYPAKEDEASLAQARELAKFLNEPIKPIKPVQPVQPGQPVQPVQPERSNQGAGPETSEIKNGAEESDGTNQVNIPKNSEATPQAK